MNDEQRTQILDNARYLREVRPVDPTEIYEYVQGSPDPADVHQVLREEAATLGMIELSDGRFEPVNSGPIPVDFDGVTELPERLSRAFEDCLVDRFGPDWSDGETGAQLRTVIRDFKRRYLHGARVTYDEATALGYGIYHLPTYYATCQYVLAELAEDGHLPSHLRVLDVGAGVGGPALGIDAFLPADALVDYHAVEPSDGAAVLEALLETTGRNFHASLHREPVEALSIDREFDLVLFANVLSELDDPETVVSDLLDNLAADGTIVCLAPADRNTAIELRAIERRVEAETNATVYSPTVRLWPHERPSSDSWSIARHPDLAVPDFQRRLDEGERTATELESESAKPADTADESVPGDGEFVNVDVQYAYSLLRTDGRRRIDYRPDPSRVSKMATTEKHVTERIDYVAIKLSHDLSSGDNSLYLVGDGSQKIDHFAVLTNPSELTSDLERAEYGDLLLFENVLVLWNDDEGAYNLVVDGQAIVERVRK